MRRPEKKISEFSEIEDIIHQSPVCRLAFSDNDIPYIVPMCFGFHKRTLYFHSSPEGRKIDILKKNPLVCFEMDLDVSVIESEVPCQWGMKYRSIVGSGRVEMISDLEEKHFALEQIMARYSDRNFSFSEKAVQKTFVFKIKIKKISGKKSQWEA